jgi:hypothetical protein
MSHKYAVQWEDVDHRHTFSFSWNRVTDTPWLFAQSGSTFNHRTWEDYQLVTQHPVLYHRQFIHDAVELCQAKDTLKVQKTRCFCKPATRSHPRKNTAPVNITQNLKSATTENVAGSRLSSPAHSLSRRMPCHSPYCTCYKRPAAARRQLLAKRANKPAHYASHYLIRYHVMTAVKELHP